MSLIGDLFSLAFIKVFASKEDKKELRNTIAESNALLDAGMKCLHKNLVESLSSSSLFPGFSEEFEKAKRKQGL